MHIDQIIEEFHIDMSNSIDYGDRQFAIKMAVKKLVDSGWNAEESEATAKRWHDAVREQQRQVQREANA